MIDHPMTFRPAISRTKSVCVTMRQQSASIVNSFSMSSMFSILLANGLNMPRKLISRMELRFIKKSCPTKLEIPNVITKARTMPRAKERKRKTKMDLPAFSTAK